MRVFYICKYVYIYTYSLPIAYGAPMELYCASLLLPVRSPTISLVLLMDIVRVACEASAHAATNTATVYKD